MSVTFDGLLVWAMIYLMLKFSLEIKFQLCHFSPPVVNLFHGKAIGLRTGLQKVLKSMAFLIGFLSFRCVGEQYKFSGFWRVGSFWNKTSKPFQVLQILFFKCLCLGKAVFSLQRSASV